MSKDAVTSAPGKENKSLDMNQLNTVNEPKDVDSDSGISSVRFSRAKVSGSMTRDENDDEEFASRKDSLNSEDRRVSDASLLTNFTITKTSSEFHLNSIATSHSSGMNNMPISSLSMLAIDSKESLVEPLISKDDKSKNSVRNFFRKIFGSSSSSSTSSRQETRTAASNEPLNIDLIHGTAYPTMSPLPITQGPIRLFIIRHGERLDRFYSSQWLEQAFDKDGNFCRFSPILPETLPFRSSVHDFDLDPPLTYKGLKDACHTGVALKEKGLNIHYCYSSPSLRCVQTAMKILEGMQLNNRIKIRIEPGLFECTAWYQTDEAKNIFAMPKFLTKKELLENKYPIDKNYHEYMNLTDISKLETELEYYQRSHAVASAILKYHENEFITQVQQGQMTSQHHIHVLFIAHAPSLETCTRKLCGGKFRPETLGHVIRNVDFLTMTVIEKRDNNCDKWIFRRNSFYGDEF